MDARIKERRRQVGRSRGQRRLLVVLGVLLVILCALSFLWLRSSSVFAIQQVSLPVLEHVPAEAFRAVVQPIAGVNLLAVSVERLETDLTAIPWVRTARVYRRFPHGLEVDIDEYTAVARVVDPDGVAWLLADDGMVLEESTPASPPVPQITAGVDVRPRPGSVVDPQVLAALPLAVALEGGHGWSEAVPLVEYISVLPSSDLVLVLQGATEVRLGDSSDLEEKFMVAGELVELYLKDGKELEYVDVRVPGRAYVKVR